VLENSPHLPYIIDDLPVSYNSLTAGSSDNVYNHFGPSLSYRLRLFVPVELFRVRYNLAMVKDELERPSMKYYRGMPPVQPAANAPLQPSPPPVKRRAWPARWWGLGAISLLVLGAGGLVGWHYYYQPAIHRPQTASVVPPAIQESVPFTIYYPSQAKLPAGYSLDQGSFSSGGGAVEFTVTDSTSRLTFTEQTKPSSQDLQTFVSSRLPLHNTLDTPNGTATIGAIGNNSFVSLPTPTNTWVLVSGPYAISQSDLSTVLKSLVH
jgi:hypothetical protein